MTTVGQRTITGFAQETHILTWAEAFLIDRKVQNLSHGTLYFYQTKLKLFTDFCDTQAITQIDQIDANFIRQFLLQLETTGHNPGGIHACYRTLKAFLLWWEEEVEPEGWKNPIRKVKAPKVVLEPLEPVNVEIVKALMDVCQKDFTGRRDKAIFLCLLDTGARAQELLNIDLADVDLMTGAIIIRQGKGRKSRTVFLGQKSRRAVRQFLRLREDSHPALFVTDESNGRLSYGGLRGMVKRRSEQAKVEPPELHSFRRAFALNMLRAGVDIYSIQKLMGHADLQVLRRYLKQTDADTSEAHHKGSPVDGLL